LNLGHYIPSFDDDPKARFMDEIAHTTNTEGVHSPKRKRPRAHARSTNDQIPNNAAAEDNDETSPQGELSKVSPDEFWERMSFRQECISGVVTAFFAVGLSSSASNDAEASSTPAPSPSPLTPQPGQVSPRMVRRIVSTLLNHHEFSTTERAVRATETLEEAIKGLCEDLGTVAPSSTASVRHTDRMSTPEPGPSDTTLQVPSTPPRRPGGTSYMPDISPNPFPEPVASLCPKRSKRRRTMATQALWVTKQGRRSPC